MKKLLSAFAAAGLLAAASSCVFVYDGHDDRHAREICASCGEWADSSACCDVHAERCDDCGMIAGSPGCCE